MNTVNRSSILNSSTHRIAALALLAFASASAQATLQYFDLTNPIVLTSSAPQIYLDVTTGDHETFPIDNWAIEIYKSSGPAGSLRFSAPTGGGYLGASLNSPLNLAYATQIGPLEAGQFYGGGGLGTAFANAGQKYAGFKFLNANTGQTDYGWLDITTGSSRGYPAAINSWAYDDSGIAVNAGVVPEPAPFAALGLGALAFLRRRRG